jgi:eukaryotic-like serine/threonine-protein kinase
MEEKLLLPDRYQYQKTLGNKAGRTTILAVDQQTGNQVVVKLLTFSDEFQWEDLRLFERETATLRSLDHPAIPRYLDSFETETDQDKSIALVQNYIPAKSLAEYLEEGRQFDESEVRELLNALLDILVYLHDRHPPVIHRDIKPSNILLGDRSGNSIGQVYLVDFGSVQTLATRAGQTMTVVGTYGYMPPEQFGGSAVPASDIYSLGCTALRLITDSHPADLPQRDLQIQFAQFTNLSSSFTQWLQKATHPSLDKRFSQALAAKEILNQPIKLYQELLPLLPQEPMTIQRLFWNFLWRSSAMGMLGGSIYGIAGGIFFTLQGIVFFPAEAIAYEGIVVITIKNIAIFAISGTLAGFVLGYINGLIVAIFTLFLPNKGKYYPRWAGRVGFWWCTACLALVNIPLFVSTIKDLAPLHHSFIQGLLLVLAIEVPFLIAGLLMGFISYRIALWYQKQTGEK